MSVKQKVLFHQSTDGSYINMEKLDLSPDVKGLPFQINWNAEFPDNISVPKVDLHSLILDFSAVSFLDISALKGLKTVQSHSGGSHILEFENTSRKKEMQKIQ